MSLSAASFANAGPVAEAKSYHSEDLGECDENDEYSGPYFEQLDEDRDLGVSRFWRDIIGSSNSPFNSDLGEEEPRIAEVPQPTGEDVREVAGLDSLVDQGFVFGEQFETRLLLFGNFAPAAVGASGACSLLSSVLSRNDGSGEEDLA